MRAIELPFNLQQPLSDNFLTTFYPYSYEWIMGGNGFKSHSFSIYRNTSTYRHAFRDVYAETRRTYGAGGVPVATPELATASVVLELKEAFKGIGYATLPELLKIFFSVAGADAFDQYTANPVSVSFAELAKYQYSRRTAEGVDFDAIIKSNLAWLKAQCSEIPGVKFKVIKPNSRNYFLNYGAFLGNTCIAVLKPHVFNNQWTVENPYHVGGMLLQALHNIEFSIFVQQGDIVEQIKQAINTQP